MNEIKQHARELMGQIGGQLLSASNNNQQVFEDYLSMFLREVVKESYKILPVSKADRVFNMYRGVEQPGSS